MNTLNWQDDHLTILDQTLLPHKVEYVKQTNIEQMRETIYQLKVRGAPAIGVAAAYGCLTGLKALTHLPLTEFKEIFTKQAEILRAARPTAVNLMRSIDLMVQRMQSSQATSSSALYDDLVAEATRIHQEDIDLCQRIGDAGAALIKDGTSILTHCNAGALATTGLGTALAPLYVAHNNGLKFKVYADETRPLLQGARLTAFELRNAGIDVTLLCDNMAADLMSRGGVDLVIVGCDRVAANGDTANKIGTLGVAILASYFKIPFYVACPSSTIDFSAPTADYIAIEMRDPDEVRSFNGTFSAEREVQAYNPAFDVTPAALITGFITEKGIITAPYSQNLRTNFYHGH